VPLKRCRNGRHYIFDYVNGNLRRYSVACGSIVINSADGTIGDSASGGIPVARAPAATAASCGIGSTLQAELQENDPVAVEMFLAMKGFWDETGGTLAKLYDVNFTDLPGHETYPGASAYDVAADANFRSRLGQLVTVPVSNLWRLILEAGAGHAGFSEGVRIVYKVRFADGTESEYELLYPRDRAQYNPRTSFTPDGQAIPEPD